MPPSLQIVYQNAVLDLTGITYDPDAATHALLTELQAKERDNMVFFFNPQLDTYSLIKDTTKHSSVIRFAEIDDAGNYIPPFKNQAEFASYSLQPAPMPTTSYLLYAATGTGVLGLVAYATGLFKTHAAAGPRETAKMDPS